MGNKAKYTVKIDRDIENDRFIVYVTRKGADISPSPYTASWVFDPVSGTCEKLVQNILIYFEAFKIKNDIISRYEKNIESLLNEKHDQKTNI